MLYEVITGIAPDVGYLQRGAIGNFGGMVGNSIDVGRLVYHGIDAPLVSVPELKTEGFRRGGQGAPEDSRGGKGRKAAGVDIHANSIGSYWRRLNRSDRMPAMRNMIEGRPARLILSFSLPLLAGNVLQQTYNLVDSLVVGNFVGKEALAAVGGTFILNFLLVSLFSGLGMGFSIVISQFFGAGKGDRVKAAVDTGYAVSLLGAIPVTVAGIALAAPLLRLLNVPSGATMEMSSAYLTILFAGTVGSFGYNLNAGILQGLGDSVSSLGFLAIATVLNIALDLLFVAVFGWGVEGVAWATVVSQTVSFVIGVVFIVRKLKLTDLRLKGFRVDAPILRECARIGLPGGFQNMLFSLGTMAIQRLINGYGPAFMAAYSIRITSYNVCYTKLLRPRPGPAGFFARS